MALLWRMLMSLRRYCLHSTMMVVRRKTLM
ncbi:hypothetical protein AZE42_14075 [Rhizopogon vesiculosus]|uniref:Uncharacterized protein n=1 Tax=Rhizopogon vesiculosus TaxID=180088 RepID=A0A1J8QD84_9AGAM|nr:hypothetical protein AZE42_14075 [Rhizopogon vesiculosus]